MQSNRYTQLPVLPVLLQHHSQHISAPVTHQSHNIYSPSILKIKQAISPIEWKAKLQWRTEDDIIPTLRAR